MSKQILFKDEARKKILAGVNKLVEIVGSTLGPKGKAVILDKGEPTFTLDGVTVAKDIIFPDKVENLGADLIRQVASKSNDEAGDGTTTATILCQVLFNKGLKGVMAGLDPMMIKKGIEEGSGIVLAEVKRMAKQVKGLKDMEDIATISSRDREIGKMIAEIYQEIGKDGIVAVEEMKAVGMYKEVVQGMEYDAGWIAPHFVTNMEKREAEMEDPYILITTQVISRNQDIYEILEKVTRTDKKSIVIVADDITGEALATCIINKLKGFIKVLAIKASGYGQNKKEFLQDLATVTGAKVISEDFGTKTESMTFEDLGRCARVIANQKRTVFVGGQGKKKEISERAKAIKGLMKDPKQGEYSKDMMEKRYAKMTGGIGVIRVGCPTESATREIHYRLEDAIKATKSALEEGVVIGAGMALVQAGKALEARIRDERDVGTRYGFETLLEAIVRPASQVIENTGAKSEVIIDKVMGYQKSKNMGYDANTGGIVDLLQAGIIDPHKVVRVALEGAVNVAGLFLITSAVVVDEPEKKDDGRNDNSGDNK